MPRKKKTIEKNKITRIKKVKPKFDKIKDKNELYNYTKQLTKIANQRLLRLEKKFGIDSWASKKLHNRLSTNKVQAWSENRRIKVNKNMSMIQLRSVLKATEQFINSETSTLQGIKNVIKRTKKSLAKTLEKNKVFDEEESIEESKKLTDSEVDVLYDMLSEDYVKDLLQYIGASEMWGIVEDSKEMNLNNEDEFFDLFNTYTTVDFTNDLDMREKINKIFERYVI